MSSDPDTLAFYDGHAAEYAEWSAQQPEFPRLVDYMARLSPGARVLDLGCGSGWAAAAMRDKGFAVDAMDASQGLADEANARYGLSVKVAPFITLSRRARYDGIWCNFALQHAPRADRAEIFARLHTALKPGGLLHLAVQKGPRDWRDDLGRYYSPFREEEMTDLLAAAGFDDPDLAHGTGTNYDGSPTLNMYVWAKA